MQYVSSRLKRTSALLVVFLALILAAGLASGQARTAHAATGDSLGTATMQIKVADRDTGNPVSGVTFTVTTPSNYIYIIGPSDSSGVASGTVDLYEVQLYSGAGVGFDTVGNMVRIEATSFPEDYDAASFKLDMQNDELYGRAQDQLYSGDGRPYLEVNAEALFPYFGSNSGGWDEGWNYDTMQTGTSFDTIGVQKVPDSGINYNVFVPLKFEVFKMPDVEYAGFKLTKVVESGTIPVPGAEFRLRLRYAGTVTLADGTQVKRTSGMYSTGTTDGFAPGTYTTDENGVLEIPKIFPISDTWWSIYEVKVPEGMADPRGSADYSDYKYSIQFLESNLNNDGIYEYTYRNNRLTGMTGVSKVLVGDGGVDMSAYADEEFTFKVRLWTEVDEQEVPVSGTFHYGSRPIRAREDADVWRTSEATTYPTLTFDENGEATVTTKPGYDHSIYIYDVPEGTLSSVEELPKDGWISLGPWPTSPDYVNHNDVYARDVFNVAKSQAKVDVEATKQLIGAELSAEQFSFELKDAQGKVLATAANAADGKVVFEGVDLPLDALEPTKITYAEATDEQKEQATLWIGHEGWGPNYLYTDDIPDEARAYFDGYVTHAEATDEQKETPGKQWAIGSVYYYDSRYTTVHDTAATYLYDDELAYTISEVVPEAAEAGMTYDTHEETVKVKVRGSEGSSLTTEVSYDADGAVFENEYTGLTDVAVTKVWDDADDQDGKRPASVTVNLLADGEQVGTATLDEAGGWACEWTDLPQNKDGKAIDYTVTEDAVEGYTAAIAKVEAADGGSEGADEPANPAIEYTITNAHEAETTSVDVTKAWSDADNQDGVRPASVTVNLLADGQAVDSAELSAEGGWKHTFAGLPKYAAGAEVAYAVAETAVAGYTAAVSGTAAEGYTVTNAHAPETTAIEVAKVWDDAENQDGKRPASVTVNLLADGKKVESAALGEAGGWKHTFAGLPKFKAGKEVAYTVTEDAVEGYTAAVDGSTVTNTHFADTTSLKVAKAWSDGDDRDGIRPASVTVNLLADGEKFGSAELSEENGWTYVAIGMPKYKAGKEISYTVEEAGAVTGYTSAVTGTAAEGYTVTNTHAPATTEVAVAKVWDDADDQDGVRPAAVTVNLLADGERVDSAQLDEAGGWRHTFAGLPANKAGKAIAYAVEEVAVEGYTAIVSGTAAEGYTVTNAHAAETTAVDVSKVWDDADDQDGIRPESVTVNLLAGGEVVDSAQLSEAGGWKHTFAGLPKHAAGAEVAYTVEEVAVEGYTATVSGTAAEGYTVTNTHAAETTAVDVSKVWDDADDQDGVRPESVTVNLLAGGEVVDSAQLDEAGGWRHTFAGLPKYAAGAEVAYTVEEAAVEGYTATVSGTAAEGYTVTNAHTPASNDDSGDDSSSSDSSSSDSGGSTDDNSGDSGADDSGGSTDGGESGTDEGTSGNDNQDSGANSSDASSNGSSNSSNSSSSSSSRASSSSSSRTTSSASTSRTTTTTSRTATTTSSTTARTGDLAMPGLVAALALASFAAAAYSRRRSVRK